MKFYHQSRATRIALTASLLAVAAYGTDRCIQGRWLLGLTFVFLGGVQIYSLWNRYWEVADDGWLKSRGYGFILNFPLVQLRYAGPVREDPRFLISRRKDIELEIAGARGKRYARVVNCMAFLQKLQHVAPQAEVISTQQAL